MTIYTDPKGMSLFGEIDWSYDNERYDLTVVWRLDDGRFFYGDDAGCACLAPFEGEDLLHLTLIDSLEIFKQHLDERQGYYNYRTAYGGGTHKGDAVAALLERLRGAGVQ